MLHCFKVQIASSFRKTSFLWTQPAHYTTARTSCSWDRRILCVVPPYQPARTWKPSRVLGWAVFFLSRAGTLKCAVSHLDKHWPQMLLYPCSRLCFALSKTWWGDPFTTTSTAPCLHTGIMPCDQSPNSLGPEKQQLENGDRKRKILIRSRQKFFLFFF